MVQRNHPTRKTCFRANFLLLQAVTATLLLKRKFTKDLFQGSLGVSQGSFFAESPCTVVTVYFIEPFISCYCMNMENSLHKQEMWRSEGIKKTFRCKISVLDVSRVDRDGKF